MTDEEVATTLNEAIGRYADRHYDIRADLIENFTLVAHRLPRAIDVSAERRELIGAFFTKEYSVEAAALFNPSVVAHLDQTGLEPGELRFIMSVRSVAKDTSPALNFARESLRAPTFTLTTLVNI